MNSVMAHLLLFNNEVSVMVIIILRFGDGADHFKSMGRKVREQVLH